MEQDREPKINSKKWSNVLLSRVTRLFNGGEREDNSLQESMWKKTRYPHAKEKAWAFNIRHQNWVKMG